MLIERLVGIAWRQSRDRHYPEAERLEVLRAALESGSDVSMVYFSASRRELTRRVVTPRRLWQADSGLWYLSGLDHLRDAERTFRVGRIREVVELRQGPAGGDTTLRRHL